MKKQQVPALGHLTIGKNKVTDVRVELSIADVETILLDWASKRPNWPDVEPHFDTIDTGLDRAGYPIVIVGRKVEPINE